MTNSLGRHLLTTTLAGAIALSITACNRAAEPVSDPVIAPVVPTTVGTDVDDSMLTTHVKKALSDNVEVNGLDFKVETRKGEVMLSGFVDSQNQAERAIAVTRDVPGVKSVVNRVSIKAGATTLGTKIDDSIITARVKTALMADEIVKSADIATVTQDGRVQLSGFVNNQEQIDNALKVARSIEGVSSVVNKMSIKK